MQQQYSWRKKKRNWWGENNNELYWGGETSYKDTTSQICNVRVETERSGFKIGGKNIWDIFTNEISWNERNLCRLRGHELYVYYHSITNGWNADTIQTNISRNFKCKRNHFLIWTEFWSFWPLVGEHFLGKWVKSRKLWGAKPIKNIFFFFFRSQEK